MSEPDMMRSYLKHICHNNAIDSVRKSPDGRYKLILYQRDKNRYYMNLIHIESLLNHTITVESCYMSMNC